MLALVVNGEAVGSSVGFPGEGKLVGLSDSQVGSFDGAQEGWGELEGNLLVKVGLCEADGSASAPVGVFDDVGDRDVLGEADGLVEGNMDEVGTWDMVGSILGAALGRTDGLEEAVGGMATVGT